MDYRIGNKVVIGDWELASLKSAVMHLEDVGFTRKEAVEYIRLLPKKDIEIRTRSNTMFQSF